MPMSVQLPIIILSRVFMSTVFCGTCGKSLAGDCSSQTIRATNSVRGGLGSRSPGEQVFQELIARTFSDPQGA